MQLHQGTYIMYFDFKKAFDSVSPKVNDETSGISNNLFLWIRKFLSNRTQAVKMNGQLSSNGDVTSGVPQGSVLGPTLFLIYINDVVDTFTDNSVKYKLFADDIRLYSTSSSPHNSSLQTAIDRFLLWSEKWQLQLAPEKCLPQKCFHQNNGEYHHAQPIQNPLTTHILHRQYMTLVSSLIVNLLSKPKSTISFTRPLSDYALSSNAFDHETSEY